jgi:hypothetical protein
MSECGSTVVFNTLRGLRINPHEGRHECRLAITHPKVPHQCGGHGGTPCTLAWTGFGLSGFATATNAETGDKP